MWQYACQTTQLKNDFTTWRTFGILTVAQAVCINVQGLFYANYWLWFEKSERLLLYTIGVKSKLHYIVNNLRNDANLKR